MYEPRGWEELNAQRRYPFYDTASLTDEASLITLPLSFVVGLTIGAPSSVVLPVYLYKLTISRSLFSLVFADSTQTTVCYGTFIRSNIIEGKSYPLQGVAGTGGTISFGKGVEELFVHRRTFTFSSEATQVLSTLVSPIEISTLNSLWSLTGDVKLQADTGITLRQDPENNIIYIGLNQPELFIPDCFRRVPCNENECNRTPVYMINGLYPASNGNFTITGDGVTVVTNADNTVILSSDIIKPADICDNYTKGPTGDPGPVGPRGTRGPAGMLKCEPCPDDPCPGIFVGDCCPSCSDPGNRDLCLETEELTQEQVRQRFRSS